MQAANALAYFITAKKGFVDQDRAGSCGAKTVYDAKKIQRQKVFNFKKVKENYEIAENFIIKM